MKEDVNEIEKDFRLAQRSSEIKIDFSNLVENEHINEEEFK